MTADAVQAPFGGTFRALRHRNFRLYFTGQLVSLIGTWMQSVAQGWLMHRLTSSAFMLGLLGLRIFEATSADITDLGEEHGHRVLRVCGKGTQIVQVPLPPAVGRAIDRATGARDRGPILLNGRSARMDRHAATRRLRRLAQSTGLRAKVHPRMLRHTFVTTMLDAGVDLRDVQIAARHNLRRVQSRCVQNRARFLRKRRQISDRLALLVTCPSFQRVTAMNESTTAQMPIQVSRPMTLISV